MSKHTKSEINPEDFKRAAVLDLKICIVAAAASTAAFATILLQNAEILPSGSPAAERIATGAFALGAIGVTIAIMYGLNSLHSFIRWIGAMAVKARQLDQEYRRLIADEQGETPQE